MEILSILDNLQAKVQCLRERVGGEIAIQAASSMLVYCLVIVSCISGLNHTALKNKLSLLFIFFNA